MLVAEEGGDDPLNLSANTAPMVINCANVELWFTANGDMTVKQHDAKHLLTNQIGCEYDENATCPTWDAALGKVFSSCLDPDEVIRHFEEVFGYILQPTRHQATWVMMKGPGGNGKSFLLNIISTLLGEHAVVGASLNEIANGVSAHFTDSLQGKLMLLDDDLKAGTLLPDDWMKKLSEAKLISANPKFGKTYNFTARCIPVILTNAWPNTVDLSDGLRRRAQVFESNHVLTEAEKDPTHARIIRENELPGVLNRLVAAYQRFLRRGERFDPPGECVAAKSNWFTSSNPTALFADLAFTRTAEQADVVKAQDVYDGYFRWMQHWEHNSRALGRNKFYEALNKLGFAVTRVHNSTVIRAVKFFPPEGANEFDE
jgi:P4 family phage/plasmid primase-like protien